MPQDSPRDHHDRSLHFVLGAIVIALAVLIMTLIGGPEVRGTDLSLDPLPAQSQAAPPGAAKVEVAPSASGEESQE